MTKFVFITGVSSGIGKSVLEKFHQNGFHIIGTVRRNEDAQTLSILYPDRLTLLLFDVTDQEAFKKAMAHIPGILGAHKLHLLVNNAGLAVPGPLELLSDEEFEYQMNVNLLSVRKVTNSLLPFLKGEHRGKIVNISSVSGILNTPYLGAYCVSKHAIESLNEIYRRELSPFGIQVVSVLPGPIKTNIWKKNLGKLDKFFLSPYGHVLKSADKLIEKSEQNGLPVEKVSQTIWKIFESKNPKNRYIVHKNPFSIWFITRIIPSKMLDNIMAKTMSRGDKMRPI
ncbi:MAG: SDR family oxidoreductase [Saprospiraceae bacterium]